MIQEKSKELKLLEINNVKDSNDPKHAIGDMIEQLTKFSNDYNQILQINKRNKYKKKKLEPLKVNLLR